MSKNIVEILADFAEWYRFLICKLHDKLFTSDPYLCFHQLTFYNKIVFQKFHVLKRHGRFLAVISKGVQHPRPLSWWCLNGEKGH